MEWARWAMGSGAVHMLPRILESRKWRSSADASWSSLVTLRGGAPRASIAVGEPTVGQEGSTLADAPTSKHGSDIRPSHSRLTNFSKVLVSNRRCPPRGHRQEADSRRAARCSREGGDSVGREGTLVREGGGYPSLPVVRLCFGARRRDRRRRGLDPLSPQGRGHLRPPWEPGLPKRPHLRRRNPWNGANPSAARGEGRLEPPKAIDAAQLP